MTQDAPTAVSPAPAPEAARGGHAANRLGAFLCWSVVFADIGTSVYYVPGILYGQVGGLAGLFVTLTLVAFVLLTLKYAEVSVRFPEGGGVVTVSARGLNPWAGAVGGMFILVDYFLTSAISSISGVQYFINSFFPRISGDLRMIVIITLLVVALLGLLNWWGIKESATVSAVFAVAALVSDIIILISIFGSLSLSQIWHYVGLMFTGGHISGVTLLTGFAGAFLAFSGLESISQLSPVMRAPRRKTVTVALALVAITVGITSPLLTFFSTTALIDLHKGAPIDPATFITALGLQFGGKLVEVFTAITASALLVFASNTAIIGAYHVFLALSRMQFFPEVIEKHNRWRGTPHVSILLATAIPMAVLIVVRGNVTILGDMYAFGLLGAFSMTCIALDVIRFRERRGETVAGAHPMEEEEAEAPAHTRHRTRLTAAWARTRAMLPLELSPAIRERLRFARAQALQMGAYLAREGQRARPALNRMRAAWPDLRYYLGFLTTFLIVVAWATNLIAKPLATEFGGGLTILGVGIAIVNYRQRQRRGEKPVFPMAMLRRIPNSRLVVLTGDATHDGIVMRTAIEGADGRSLVFMYLGAPPVREVQPLAINDPYFRDDQAKRTFSRAANAASRAGVPAQFIYRVGGPASVIDIWRVVRPEEIIAEAVSGKPLAKAVSPEYVRFQQVNGTKIAHYIRHHVSTLDEPEDGAGPPTAPGKPVAASPAPEIPTKTESSGTTPTTPTNATGLSGKPIPKKITGIPSAGVRRPPARKTPPPTRQQRPTPKGEKAPDTPLEPTAGAPGTIDEYVWTGTQLVRKSELDQESPEGQEQDHADENQPK